MANLYRPLFRRLLSRSFSELSACEVKSPDFKEEVFKGMSSHFPCLQKMEGRADSVKRNGGIRGMYGEDVSGYQIFHHKKPFKFELGGVLPELSIAYETWGELNSDRSNAILIHTGLSGSSHAKSSEVRTECCPTTYLLFVGVFLLF